MTDVLADLKRHRAAIDKAIRALEGPQAKPVRDSALSAAIEVSNAANPKLAAPAVPPDRARHWTQTPEGRAKMKRAGRKAWRTRRAREAGAQ